MVESKNSDDIRHLPVVIVGTGFGGLALAVKLKDAGIDDFTLFERAEEVGGTWRDNTYPGCACDVASNLYSLSFAPNPNWTRTHGTQPEIFEYMKNVANDFDLYPYIRFNTELKEAHWDAQRDMWFIKTNQGQFTCDVLITATGPFGEPVVPQFTGAKSFKGHSFHTFNWDHNYDLTGKKVAIIGTGATSIQLVPEIQSRVDTLTVFQRTPSHVLPRVDFLTTPLQKAASRFVPYFQRSIRSMWYAAYEGLVGLPQFVDSRFLSVFETAARYHLNNQIEDPVLREKLTPDYRFGCKRPVFSSKYFRSLQKDNVDLVTEGIQQIREHCVVDATGKEHPVDVIIYATGFRVPHQISERLTGDEGRSLATLLEDRPKSYLGTSFAGFPNLFMMLGPFSLAGNQSAIFTLEMQADYITKAIRSMRKKALKIVDVREDVMNAFSDDVGERAARTSWVNGGCKSYYQHANGGNAGLWPNWSFVYRWKTRKFDVNKFNIKHDSVMGK
ncbi:MAG: NAD(P)/FAD-dependent oxidoreductase [Pseudomonadales bacterium]|nr:NAD(P)/FAD-dependent oxidoreductase [Pseudomonadales bacterium]